jgi:RNA polymerase sigma-70 factor, ECF subfamily
VLAESDFDIADPLVRPTLARSPRGGESMDDQERILQGWLGAIASGDQAALASLYDTYSTPLYSMACRMLSSPEAAAEVVQDVFLSIWKEADRYDATRAKGFTWMVMLLRRKAIDRIRYESRRLPALPFPAPHRPEVADEVAPPDGAVQTRERSMMVGALLQDLPAEQRKALELAFFDGWTHQEIAQQLSEPLGTVKSRIRLALQALRRQLQGGAA